MITARQAKRLLEPGDVVYIHENCQVSTVRIRKIFADSLLVEGGYLYFADHGELWWLTRKIAEKKLLG
jgi:hypothetical protein